MHFGEDTLQYVLRAMQNNATVEAQAQDAAPPPAANPPDNVVPMHPPAPPEPIPFEPAPPPVSHEHGPEAEGQEAAA